MVKRSDDDCLQPEKTIPETRYNPQHPTELPVPSSTFSPPTTTTTRVENRQIHNLSPNADHQNIQPQKRKESRFGSETIDIPLVI